MLTLLQMLICKDSGKIEVNSSNGFHQMIVENEKQFCGIPQKTTTISRYFHESDKVIFWHLSDNH